LRIVSHLRVGLWEVCLPPDEPNIGHLGVLWRIGGRFLNWHTLLL
jgi:hypothetical protein